MLGFSRSTGLASPVVKSCAIFMIQRESQRDWFLRIYPKNFLFLLKRLCNAITFSGAPSCSTLILRIITVTSSARITNNRIPTITVIALHLYLSIMRAAQLMKQVYKLIFILYSFLDVSSSNLTSFVFRSYLATRLN